jgi:hypothetical protein
MDPQGGRDDCASIRRREGWQACAPVRQLPARRNAVRNAGHPQRARIRFHARPFTILGESDGNRLRRIYTDGRPHPEDPDPTFHGHSIGHWEGDALMVDTIGVLPEVYIAVSEAAGVPNNGDMHITERIHLKDPDTLLDDLEITAPKVLTAPWKTTRIYLRRRGQKFDIIEGVYIQGLYSERVDENGDAVFVPIPHQVGGNLVAPR